jgi:heat shock protein HslJ
MREARTLLAIAATAFAGLAVVGGTSAGSNALTGNVWVVRVLLGTAPLLGTDLTSQFTSAGRVSGSAGCNHYGAGFTEAGSTIQISSIASTQMACVSRIMAQESVFLKALGSARSFRVNGAKLTLKASGGRALVTYEAQSQQLAGTSWNVLAYNNGEQGVESVSAATKLTAMFDKAGHLTGFAGCNSYAATYTGTSPKISIAKVSSTRKECAAPPGVMDQEIRYLAALATAATYQIEGSTLELRTATGALAAEFQRK